MNVDEIKSESLLIATILIFAFLSAVATKIGADSILDIENSKMENFFSILIAIGLCFFLIYLTLQLAFFIKNRNIIPIIMAYFFIAFISFIFNFSAFLGWFMSEKYLLNDALELQQNLTNLGVRAIAEIDDFHDYTIKINKTDSLWRELIMEEKREDRPGRRWRYYKINKIYNAAKVDSQSAANSFITDKNHIESQSSKAIELLEKAMKEKNSKNLIAAIEEGIRTENVLLAYIEARNPDFIHPKFSSVGLVSKKPNFALSTLLKLFNSLNEDNNIVFSKDEKSAIILSILFGFLLDFPIFLTLVVLRLGKEKAIKKDTDLFSAKNSSNRKKKKDIFY